MDWLVEMVAAGATEWAVAAGARNSPLLAALAARPDVRVWRFADERSLGFFALGRAMAMGRPVGLCVTSGTAAAELLPALIEARAQGLPLIAVTADRPRSHRGRGTPQAIDQAGLYGDYAPTLVDWEDGEPFPLVDWASLSRPVHVNACLSEPLLAEKSTLAGSRPKLAPPGVPSGGKEVWDEFVGKGDGIVLAGGILPWETRGVAAALRSVGWPVVTEITANLGASFQGGGERTLRSWRGKRALRVGAVPGWRWWRDLEEREDVEVLSVSRTGVPGLARPCAALAAGSDFWEAWEGAPPGGGVRRSPDFFGGACSEARLLHALAKGIPDAARVFWGNSMAIRLANLAPDAYGFSSYASRGVNGIDGQASTAFGISADSVETWAFLGDLTLWSDVGAGWITGQLPRGRRRLVVMNNDGGEIFRHVKDLAGMPLGARDLLFNPHGRTFEDLARFWGFEHRTVRAPADVTAVLASDAESLLAEVFPSSVETGDFWAKWRVASAT